MLTTIDFETYGIQGRPDYPPKPVGVSIKPYGQPAKYYSFGHPTGNNCTEEQAREALRKIWFSAEPFLMQNAKFDLDVADVHWGLPIPPWDLIHDTMFLLFLDDPNQTELGLKPSAERLLGWPPEEQDAVADWLIKNQPVPGVKISRSKNSPNYFGAYIAYAPGDLVGAYANGDVDRTEALYDKLYPSIVERGMLEAYNRERRLMPCLLDMERQGVPVDLPRLRADVALYNKWLVVVDQWLLDRLGADINLDSGDELVDAMVLAGVADATKIPRTPKSGKYATNKDALMMGVVDKQFLSLHNYRTQLLTCMNTFMRSWLTVAEKTGGVIYTSWNQVKNPKGDGTAGARTGRLSSNPNFQNIANEFKPLFAHEQEGLPVCPIEGLPPLPKLRSYIVAFRRHVLIGRDASQQELRILAHFDGEALLDRYISDPWTDLHDFAKSELEKRGLYYERKQVKITNFGLIYGMGVGKLAAKADLTVERTRILRDAILGIYSGLKDMNKEMKRRAKFNLPIRTWGGREYYCEPSKLINGHVVDFAYKLVNTLIQSSASEHTKEAIIRFYAAKKPEWKLLLTVHDELLVSSPEEEYAEAMEVLRISMESVEFDVKMLSEGFISETNWAEKRDYDKRGVRVWKLN